MDYTTDAHGEFTQAVEMQSLPEVMFEVEETQRKPYGKLVVLANHKLFMVSLGPDYCMFLPTFFCFLLAGIYITTQVFSTTDSIVFRLITIIICLGQPLAYLTTALSNPGVVVKSVKTSEDMKECKKCQIWVKRDTFHCGDCQVCIEEYDHHCPWVSKCIGKRNIRAFYVFLALTPIFFVYSMIAFVLCASLQLASSP